MIGTITRVVFSRGFAFIRGQDDKLSRFMHVDGLADRAEFDQLEEGMIVEFDSVDGGKSGNGLRAVNVKIVK